MVIMASNQGINLFHQLLIPVTLTLSLFFLHSKKLNKNILFYFRLIFLLLILVLMSMILFYKMYLWFSNTIIKGFTLGQVKDLAACIWCLESLVSFVYIVHWQYSNRYGTFRDLLFNATGLKGMIDNKMSITVVAFVTTAVCLGYFINVLIALISNLFNLTQFKEKDLVYNGVMLGKSELDFLVAIGLFYNDLCWNLATEIYVLLCVFVTNEVKYLNKRIQTEPQLDRFSLELYLDMHKKLVTAVTEFDNAFNGYYFFVLLFQMPLTILLIFNVVTREVTPVEWILFGMWIGSGVIKLFVLSLLPSQLHEQVKINIGNSYR